MAKITMKGKDIHTNGDIPSKGKNVPDFKLVGQDLSRVSLENFSGKKKILNIFPSFDTNVCAQSVRKFFELCNSRPDLVVLNISMDLPFAAKRFCAAEGLDGIKTLSAFNSSFPKDYGVKIVDGPMEGLCARVVIVLNENNQVIYTQLVPEITHEPNYHAALDSLQKENDAKVNI